MSNVAGLEPRILEDVQLLTCPGLPGVIFVWPLQAADRGFACNGWGTAIPYILFQTQIITEAELLQAANHVGEGVGMKRVLRDAVKKWLRSERANRFVREGETRDEWVMRVRALTERFRQEEAATAS